MQEIKFIESQNLKEKPDMNNLGFGNYYTDYMFVMDYTEGKGWHDARIEPYGPLTMDPASMVLHYGQATFEGLKAYYGVNGDIRLFRPEKNMARLNESNKRLCIPEFDGDFVIEGIKKLVNIEKEWIPTAPGTSLYIRPFVIATDVHVGVHPSHTYKFIVILSPVGAYYKEGINPVKIYVEDDFVRAVKGGLGYAKTAANYAASLKSQVIAEEKGYTQVLWLDGIERKYIEEVGTMNVMFVIDGEVVTPELNGSILPGITRMSTIELLKDAGYKVTERRVSIEEVFEAAENGKLDEAFGTGTAAVISPIGLLEWEGKKVVINDGKIGPISQKVYDTITGIQSGAVEDKFGWVTKA
ncbi:branched chain amino acid aminotransferase [Tyzzerella sp. An114]|uniref:branched-chain amino acid aminotransferase n=1 Tax=Tyzzerella sp. An114 TaxID=1965545 RepID=UPI000B44CBEF|nr:branched-chain amino acid aminotransferase [Tyzzerella sp. An114]OUQ60448.1 branched chain amino acid aminotransferase [Tyzzerella sp. An114]HIT72101.1 branched-chain amino acid aminotransferase [Candidatus Fimicola cottocaccae]